MVAQLEPTVLDFRPPAPVSNASIELEEAILGGILLNPDTLAEVEDLPVAAFTLRNHRLIFNAILEVSKAGRKPDANTVALQMHKAGVLEEAGGKTKLAQLMDRTLHSWNIAQYAQILKEDYQRYFLSSSFRKIAELSETEGDLGSVLEQAKEQLAQFEDASINKKPTLEQAAERAKDILQAKNPELIENIELEKVREAFGMSSYDWERKIIRPIKRELNAERFKFDLLNLLGIDDPVERIRQQALLAPQYQMTAGAIERALELIKQRTSTPETQWFGLDEFFDLESEGLQWLIPELLPAGETVILAGSPKSGKTLLAVDVAFAVATGESAFLKETVAQGRVLIVSVDESAHSTKAKLLKRGFRREDADNVQVMTKFDIRQIRALEERLETFRPALVIIDSLKRITHGQEISENSAEFADNIYTLKELLTRYGAAGILIHHTNKNSEAMGVGKLRGSSAIAGAVWGTWQLDHIPKPDPNNKKKLIIDPSDPKRILSVFARDTEGQQLRIELDLENNSWTNHGGIGDSEEWEEERKTLQVRIIDILSRNNHLPGLSGREIIVLMGMTPEEGRGIYTVLNRMVGKRLISCKPAPGDKRYNIYSLPNQQPPPDSGGNSPSDGRSDPSDDSHTPPSPPPSGSNVEYSAESQSYQDFPILNKYSTNYSTNTQQPEGDTTPVNYSNADSATDSEILNNLDLKQGGGGSKDDLWDDGDNNKNDWNHYPACTCSWCLSGKKTEDKPTYPLGIPEYGGTVCEPPDDTASGTSSAITPAESQQPETESPAPEAVVEAAEHNAIAPASPKVGDLVRVPYGQLGIVEMIYSSGEIGVALDNGRFLLWKSSELTLVDETPSPQSDTEPATALTPGQRVKVNSHHGTLATQTPNGKWLIHWDSQSNSQRKHYGEPPTGALATDQIEAIEVAT